MEICSGKDAERSEKQPDSAPENDAGPIKKPEKEVLDLSITNRGKDFFIDRLQKERDDLFQKVVKADRKVGELETRLRQLKSVNGVDPSPGA